MYNVIYNNYYKTSTLKVASSIVIRKKKALSTSKLKWKVC